MDHHGPLRYDPVSRHEPPPLKVGRWRTVLLWSWLLIGAGVVVFVVLHVVPAAGAAGGCGGG
jgi:hypothetical protein